MWNRISKRVTELQPSAIRKYFAIPADAISLGVGEPDFTTPKVALDAAIRSLESGQTHYTANSGIEPLRAEISAYLDRLYSVNYDPDKEIVVTVGASEALFMAISTVLDPGDEMIVVTPCFVSYQAGVHLAGGKSVEVACRLEDDFDLNVSEVEAAITDKTRGILIGFPCNPTGAVASRESLQKLVDIAIQHDLAIISDEIYGRLIYGVEHVCVAGLEGAFDRCLIVNGFSKSHAMTGLRLGYLAGPRHIVEQSYKIHQYLIMSAPTTAQYAGVVALRDCEEDVERMRKEYDRRRRLVVDGMNSLGLTTFEPRGAFYAFPQITSTGLSSEQFADQLLAEEKVAMVPGSGFGKGGDGFMRISYATAYNRIEMALERVEKFLKKI